MQLLSALPQPLAHRVGGHLAHASRGANAQPFRQACQHVDDALHRGVLAMKNRAVVLRKIAVARRAVQLSPGTTTGMSVGPQVVQPPPPSIVTSGVGTKMPRGI